jgi:hypothetical protein
MLRQSENAERDETRVAEGAEAGKAECRETRDPAGGLLHCAGQHDRKREHDQAK